MSFLICVLLRVCALKTQKKMEKINLYFGLSLLILHLAIGSLPKGIYQDIDWFKQAQDEIKRALEVNRKINTNIAKNIILINAGGFDHATATAARIFKGQLNGLKGEETLLEFEKFPHIGLSKTYCAEKQGCEGTASVTAMLCGVKTNFRVVGLSDKANDDSFTSRLGAEIPFI
ncbi:hypothetical protein KUTeg_019385 [Tegillarca granosa]|uniref:alkaline phosphatase n=1 Tax=Tegillarca granosa TaxID=220873 RepID=A0ABQ9ECC6_TEGGR|nr:hypothetical protein KUTeg_019385 [Tegillarca granosa]